jgi:hypothetical protein
LPPYWLPGLGGVVALGVDGAVDGLVEGEVDVDCGRDEDGEVDADGDVARGVDAREAGNSPAALDPLSDPLPVRDAWSGRACDSCEPFPAVAVRATRPSASPSSAAPPARAMGLRRPKSRAISTMSPKLRLDSVSDRTLQPAGGLLDQLGGGRLVLVLQLVAGAAHGLGEGLDALRRSALLLLDLVRSRGLHLLGRGACRLGQGVARAVPVARPAKGIGLLT